MSYNKRQKLQDNIEAIRLAFALEQSARLATEEEKKVLRQYSGFGGLKFILNPCEKAEDIEHWSKGDRTFFEQTRELYGMLESLSKSTLEYRTLVQSLKNSVLSSFYTPQPVIDAVSKALSVANVDVKNFLDPSSGRGSFVSSFLSERPDLSVTAFEKDLITGKVLKALHGEHDIHVAGFETIEERYQGYFDVAASNIPFGDISVFDPAYINGSNEVNRLASKTIHNYFFLKTLDQVRDGGLVAFITSQGVMDSPQNKPIRQAMMERAYLLGAIRLPNNLFVDEAGTEVGSDLILLQKDNNKPKDYVKYAPEESAFIDNLLDFDREREPLNALGLDEDETSWLESTNPNAYIFCSQYLWDSDSPYLGKISHGTDPYGKPATVSHWNGSMESLGRAIQERLEGFMQYEFNSKLYQDHAPKVAVTPDKVISLPTSTSLIQARSLSRGKKKDVSSLQMSLFDLWDTLPEVQEAIESPSMSPRAYQGDIHPYYREGIIVENRGQLGTLSSLKKDCQFVPLALSDDQESRLRQYVKLRDTYENLYNNEASSQTEDPENRSLLNQHYDEFVKKYGALNTTKNRQVILMDALGRDSMSLERVENGQYVKSDIFAEPTAIQMRSVLHVETADEALMASLNRTGGVDLAYISNLCDLTEDELKERLREKIYYNPIEGGYEIVERFLSGNVVEKLDYFEDNYGAEVLDAGEEEVGRSYKALQGVRPRPIPFEELDFNFGERWMPTHYFSEFATELFGTEIHVSYAPNLDEFVIKCDEYWNDKITSEYAVQAENKNYSGLDLLRHALYDTTPFINKVVGYKDNGDTIMGPDHEKMQLAASKIDTIREGFSEWIQGHSVEWKEAMADMYNRKFNCFVRANYDGSHQIFPGLDLKALKEKKGISDIYGSQKDAVWMILQNGGGICDHEVGTGKTFIMCLAAHEMKRLGLCHKPIIIGMKANVNEIATTYQSAYPNDRILYAPTESKDFKDRETFFNRMKNNDWDCIIMSHDQFNRIPQSVETMRNVLYEEMQALEEALEVYVKQGSGSVSKKQLKGLEQRKENLAVELANLNYKLRTRADDVVDFKTMGIDHIFVDESQQYKNLPFTTRNNRVAGLGDPKGSQRARNLQYAIRTIQDRTGKDLGATFLSGTTISNSLTELYLLFKYLRPRALDVQDIHSFDAWAAIFARKSRDYEINVAGQIVMKERYRHFIKVPELAAFYNEITDYKTAADVGLERPKMEVSLENIQPTEDHQDFSKRLLEFAQSGDGKLVFRPELEGNELQAKMLLVTGMGKKASLSPKLVNPDYHEGDDTKIGFAAKNIADYYRKYDAQKGTQFVFCDLSTPKKGEWSAYQELKNRLVNDYGIPEEEVQFIQDHGTERKRKAVIDKMNKGEVRVLMGSTTTLGTGVNAQERAVAVHHLDLPWRPSDMEQRNGRAVRKGNLVARDFADNKVDVLVYAVERSLDSYNFYLLQAKSDFIRQMKTGSLGKREFDQGGEDEESGMPFAEYVAITSGNTDLLERAKLEKRILGLESERKAFYKQQQVVQRKLDDARGQLTHHENILGKLEQDRNVLKEVLSFKVDSDMDAFERLRDESGVLSYTSDGRNVQLQHITFDLTQDEPLGDYLQKAAHQEVDGEAVVLYFMEQGLDWPLVMTSQTEYNPKTGVNRWTGNHFGVRGKSGILYTYNNGKVSLANKQKAASYPFMALARIPDLIAAHEAKKNEYLRQIPELERIASKEWEKAEELKTLKTQMQELDKKINMEMDIKTLQQQGQVSVPEELPYEIEHHNYGRQPWELKFAVKDFPYLNRNDLNDIGDKYHGSIRSYYGNVHGDFKHQFGAEEAFKELSRLNAEHRKDLDWLKNAASDIYESSSVYAVKRLNEMGLDRQGNPLTGENSHKMKVLSLGDYSIPEIRDLAHGVKDRHDVATHVAAAALSRVITEMADANKVVLVPMPSHNGYGGGVEKLCREMSDLYDIPYEDVLYSSPYESLYSWKKQHPNEPLPDLLFGARKDRINNKIPVFIDNVIDTGHTARAALDALGGNPVMVVVGSTGKHQTEGDELEVEVVENGLQYIHENTPDGVGFTGVSRKEIDNLLKLAQKFDDTSSAWAADHELRKLGIDKYTGYPLYMVEHICDRWIYTYDDLDAPVKELLSKGSAENVFTQEELAKISPEDMKMFREVYEEVQNPNLLSYDYRRRLMVLYDVVREKLLNEYEIDWETGKRARFEYVDNTSANEGTSHVAEDDNTIRYMKGENYFSVREEGDLYVVDLGTKIDVLFDDMPEWFGKTAHELNGMFEKVTGVDGAVNNRGTFLDRETAERFAVAANEHYDHKLRELEEVASSRHNVQSKLRDALIDRMRKAGISVVTDVQEGQRALDEANGIGVKAMGSRTESKKALIARSASLLNLDAEKQLIIDVFTGKRNHQVLTIERSDGSLFSFEISEGNEIKGGTRHALYRHFGTGEGVILITDILAIPDVLRSGDRKQDGNKFLYSLKRDNKELTVVTEKRGKKEVFVTLYSDVTLNEKASLSKSKNTNLIARSNDNEALSDTKVQQNIESTIEDDEKIREQRNFSSETDENVLNFGEKHGFLMTNIANVGHYARAMREGDMLSASNAFRAIKEEMGMWYKADYPESTLADFIKEFEPVKEDLFKEFGNLDELRAERESERVSGYTMEEIEEKVGSRLTNNNYTHIHAINPFVNLLRSDKISEYVDYRSVIPTPSMNDYYVATRAEFKNVGAVPTIANERRMHDTWVQALLAAEAENMATWEEMKESGQYEFQKSPKSDSEYLLDRQTGDIYRFSNHWGVVASCEWGIDQFLANEAGNGMYQIAKCNISDFKPVLFSNMLVGNPAYDNAYIDALDKTISNYEKLLASRVEMTDFVRQRVESVLEDYKTLQKRYDEEHYRTKNGARFHKVDTYPIFVSNAQLAVERIQQQKATPLQWLNMITKNGGIKAGEDKWMGLSVWLKENTSKTLTKGEVLDFISQNAIEVEEVNYVNPFDYQIEKEDIISSPEYQGLVEDLIEYDNDENPYVNQEKFNKLRHEDNNFFNGFSIDYWGEGIDVDDPRSAAMYLGLLDGKFKEINDTRLSYTTEGLENRKEVALVVPSVEPYNESDEVHFGDAGEGRAVAWVRFGETTDADGNKVLVIDEIQSKRHQDGRENGYVQIQKVKDVKELDNKLGWGFSLTYKEAEKIETLMQAPFVPSEYHIHPERTWLDITEDRYQYHASFGNKTYDVGKIIVSNEDEAREYLFKIINRDVQEHNRKFEEYSQRGVPDAPFDKNWHELAMKRILRYAADNEYDRIAWTTGEQQAERYDLSKSFNYVSYNKDSQKLLAANVVDGVIDYNLPSIEERVHQEKLADYVGKENALKLIEKRTLQGEELRIGGEGMESFYDKILVNFINKYGKQWDVQVEELHLLKQRLTMHSIPVNEAMKESVSLGQPMFFKTTDGKAYGFVKDDVVYIDPRIATAETPIHEYTHLWAEALRQHNPEEWKNIVNLMKGATDIWNKVKKEYSELTDDDTLADEVLAQYSGKRGYQRLMEETKGQKDLGVLDKLAEALGRFWNAVADFLHIHFTSKEEVADRVLHDLLTGVNPLEYAENIVDQRETEAFKGWFGDWKNDTKNSSKVVDSEGKPLVVEHATNADFTEFDISHIGENSKDNGLFGAGFYFGTHAPGWMQESRNTMRVYLDIKHPFEVTDDIVDIYSEICGKMDTPAMRGLTITGFNDHQSQVGTLVDQIKNIDDLIKNHPEQVQEMMVQDEELEYIHPNNRQRVWREHEIVKRSGIGSIALSWQSFISNQIGSYQFSAAAIQDGYDGVIVDRGDDYKEYVVFEANQIKSATYNVGTFNINNNDIRFHFIGEEGARQLDQNLGGNYNSFLEKAKYCENMGYAPHYIKFVTGWEKGVDDKWRYELGGIRDFNPYGNQDWLSHHPEVVRYRELHQRDVAQVMDIKGFQPLSEEEKSEMKALAKDSNVRYFDGTATQKNPASLTVKDYMDAPMLFAAYPELRDLPVKVDSLSSNGKYVSEVDAITGETSRYIVISDALVQSLRGMNANARQQMQDTFIHEIQHYIQEKEGFARGGNLSTVATMRRDEAQAILDVHRPVYEEYQYLDDCLNSAEDIETAMRYFNAKDEFEKEHAHELKAYQVALETREVAEMDMVRGYLSERNFTDYQRLAGEVEARNAVRRSGMSFKERWKSSISSTEDVPREEQILNFRSSMAASMERSSSRKLTVADREAGGALVEQLRKMGIVVHTDLEENRKKLREFLLDKSDAGKVRYMETERGQVYGYSYKGEMYLDMRKVDAELPLARYAHLWVASLRRVNPDNWKHVVSMFKADADTWKSLQEAFPEYPNEDDLVEAAIVKYSGKQGAEKLQRQLQNMSTRDADYRSRWGNIFQNITHAIQNFWKHVGDSFNIRYSSKEELADQILKDFSNSVNPVKKVEKWLQERDKAYADAVIRNDMDTARALFWEALSEHVGNGITPFMAVDGYRGKLDRLARDIKDVTNTEAINQAADLMAPYVRAGMVLVPAPGHEGYATHTLALANAISERSYVPVADVLVGVERARQYDVKRATGKPILAEKLGIRKIGELPKWEGVERLPVVIDNVVHSGNTAEACVKALGKGVVLSLASAVSQERHVASLKSLAPVVYDKKDQLIPLSKRFELKSKWLGRVVSNLSSTDLQIQGLGSYSLDDIKKLVKSHVDGVLKDSFSEKNITVKEITVIGSRTRDEANEGSDLDILVEYEGNGVREDAMFNALNEEPLVIDGIKVDINPINPHYSLNTTQWLERDAAWRAEDTYKSNQLNNSETMKAKVRPEDVESVESDLLEARGNLMDIISEALDEMNGHVEIAQTELTSVPVKGDWKNEGNGHVFMEVIKGEHNVQDAMFHDVHVEVFWVFASN